MGTETSLGVGLRLELLSLQGVPRAEPGDRLAELVEQGLIASGLPLLEGDILVVTSKLLSRCEGRFVDLSTVQASAEAGRLAAEVDKEPELVELILAESQAVSRAAPGVLITRHRLGHISANSGIDRSNATPRSARESSGPWVLLLPADPNASARTLRHELSEKHGVSVGVLITDTCGRPQRLGTVGMAIGLAGLPALVDHRGRPDLDGRVLQSSTTALADQLAAAADLMAGQADEGRPITIVRGLSWTPVDADASELNRPPSQDLYR